jgi:SnoaL-like domain
LEESRTEKLAIQELVSNWVIWRDMGDWERLSTIWHPEGRMTATWLQAPYAEFIEASRKGFANGVRILHLLGGTAVDVRGNFAVSQTKVTITQRAFVDERLCDVSCLARHYDFWEKRDSKWGLVLRESIYDKDRIDPVEPGATLRLDRSLLQRFPENYCHLAYVQTKVGYVVHPAMPCSTGPEVEALYARGAAWLEKGSL